MTSQSFRIEDVLLSVTQKPSVVVQVDELSALSPTTEAPDAISRVVEVNGKVIDTENKTFEPVALPISRSRTNQGDRSRQCSTPALSTQRSSSHEAFQREKADKVSPLKRRALRMNLPSFKSLGISSFSTGYFGQRLETIQHDPVQSARSPPFNGRAAAQSFPAANSTQHISREPPWGSTPLLTPPEDADSIKWNNALLHNSNPRAEEFRNMVLQDVYQTVDSLSKDQSAAPDIPAASSTPSMPLTGESSVVGPSGIEQVEQQDDNSEGSPLARAIRPLISTVCDETRQTENIHMIAQVLPQPAVAPSLSKPAFEEVTETLQARQSSEVSSFITITHAVPPRFEMKDVPTSPPATPNNPMHSRDDYFGQLVFSNAAIVSAYHSHNRLLNATAPPSPNTIVAPSSIQLCVLERYIPPTSTLEYGEFFNSTGHSVLVDRLAEISSRDGRLLLVYPTKMGAETFKSSYLAPIMDPFLREFIFLNNLYFQLGHDLSEMSAIDEMMEFEQMEARIKKLCRAISNKYLPRGGPKSKFTVIHSSKGEATIDRKTWKEWYLQQELPRIREVVVQYHKNGGRMPQDVGHREITAGVLARQVVDGIAESNEPAGEVPMELGMFVIQRTAV